MHDPVIAYTRNLRKMLAGIFKLMDEHHIIPVEARAYVRGYTMSARTLKILSAEDQKQIVEEENQRVFGMSVAERKKKVKCKVVSVLDEEYLAIPAVMRKDLSIW